MRVYKKRSLLERFTGKYIVDAAGCWLWTGKRDAYGYGSISKAPPRFKDMKAHRAAYLLFVGAIPEGKEVAHHCDVRNCVNPDHLYAATHTQNIADRTARKREPRGEQCSWAKVDRAGVERIRSHVGALDGIALELGISRAQAYRIRSGDNWA